MTTVEASKTDALADLEPMFRKVGGRMTELGLNFSAWSADGESEAGTRVACSFCRTVHGGDPPCPARARENVARACEEGRSFWRESAEACCSLWIPIRRRRRIVGVAMLCYPTTRWLDEEFLARTCDALGLDRQVVASEAAGTCRHAADEAEDLLRICEWVLEDEQSIATATGELTTLSTNLSSTYEELSLLYSISGAMKVTQQPEEFLQEVCRQVREVMNVSAAVAVIYARPPVVPQDTVVMAGDLDLSPPEIRLLAFTEIASLLAEDNRVIVDNAFSWRRQPRLSRALRNYTAAPLPGEEPLGMLLAINKKAGDFNSADMKLISSIGSQSAVFLSNNILYADLQDLLMGVLHALTATIDAKDPYTSGHSNRVAIISRRLSEECGLEPEKVQQIYLAGLLHDIGKIGVPEATLCKPGRLTDEEYEAIKKHPGIGAKILGGIRQLDDVLGGILCHHERLDGRGYPQGLAGDEVPLEARIIGLADCFDAMTSDRTYRGALPLSAVLDEIRKCAGTQFDPNIAEKFLALDLEKFLDDLRKPAETVFPVPVAQEADV